MIWALGITFLILVVAFAVLLAVKSREIRTKLGEFSRNRRLFLGVGGSLASFAFAFGALMLATTVSNWNQPSGLILVGVLCLMLFFVVFQVLAMLCIVSIVTDSETIDDSKRS